MILILYKKNRYKNSFNDSEPIVSATIHLQITTVLFSYIFALIETKQSPQRLRGTIFTHYYNFFQYNTSDLTPGGPRGVIGVPRGLRPLPHTRKWQNCDSGKLPLPHHMILQMDVEILFTF